MNFTNSEKLTAQFSELDETRQAYLAGLMDGLAMRHDRRQDAGVPEPEKKTVAAGPSVLR